MAKKKAFGGYAICFKGCTETAEEIFGQNVTPAQMTKKLWAYVKAKGLGKKS